MIATLSGLYLLVSLEPIQANHIIVLQNAPISYCTNQYSVVTKYIVKTQTYIPVL